MRFGIRTTHLDRTRSISSAFDKIEASIKRGYPEPDEPDGGFCTAPEIYDLYGRWEPTDPLPKSWLDWMLFWPQLIVIPTIYDFNRLLELYSGHLHESIISRNLARVLRIAAEVNFNDYGHSSIVINGGVVIRDRRAALSLIIHWGLHLSNCLDDVV
jgi:hypothetical protein